MQRAEARLRPERLEAGGRTLTVVAPINGVVLRRRRESAGVVPGGEPLVEIGDPQDLEIVSDLLSTDAVQVRPGAVVHLQQWGGSQPLTARVRRVEPSGFMKVSALGVEEQRVNVVMDFDDTAEASTRLGDGYRVELQIVIWEAGDVVQVPTSALFRHGEEWATYVMKGGDSGRKGVATRTIVTIGHRNSQTAEVLAGLSVGAHVILHPPDTLTDSVRVAVREANR